MKSTHWRVFDWLKSQSTNDYVVVSYREIAYGVGFVGKGTRKRAIECMNWLQSQGLIEFVKCDGKMSECDYLNRYKIVNS